jgi:hypothetical protein
MASDLSYLSYNLKIKAHKSQEKHWHHIDKL